MGKYTTSYFDSPNEPLFPFGFGLSYTDFNIDFVLSSTEMTKNSEIVVTANIENIGDKLGTQTVQLYLQDITASVSRPVKQLVGFENITLKPHEKGQIKFVIKYNMIKCNMLPNLVNLMCSLALTRQLRINRRLLY